MSYYRYTRLQQYINGQPTDTYTKGERVDNVDYSTYGTCMGSSANTRWVSIPQTVCYDGDLWSMEKEQISYDNRISWVDTGNTRRASVIEQSSSQCFMSEWRVVPGEYICMMYAKWPKEAEYLSYDGGQTWTATGNIRRGETVIELLSTDCGVIYQWIPTGEYMCVGYNKYVKEKQVYSIDNGTTWTDTDNRRPGGLVEADSPYCGYEQYIYQWVDVSGEYVCQGTTKYKKQKEQRSSDMGVSWEDTGNTRQGEVIEVNSFDCGYVAYRWVDDTGYECVGYDKYNKLKEQSSTNGIQWVDTGETKAGDTLLDSNSMDCGYVPKAVIRYTNGDKFKVLDDNSTSLTQTEIIADGHTASDVELAWIYNKVQSLDETFLNCTSLDYVNMESPCQIGLNAFKGCTSLKTINLEGCTFKTGTDNNFYGSGLVSVSIPASITSTTYNSFAECTGLKFVDVDSHFTSFAENTFYNCTSLEVMRLNPTTPPTFGQNMLYGVDTQNLKIIVPCESLSAYKSASGWSTYAENIISNSACEDHSDEYLTVEAVSDTLQIRYNYNWNDNNGLYYSVNNGEWQELYYQYYTFHRGDIIRYKGVRARNTDESHNNYFQWSGKMKVYGNPISLLAGDNFQNVTDISEYPYAFRNLFFDSMSVDTNVTDASGISLPATTLSKGCYYGMFYGCRYITIAPELPTTTLAAECYYRMFFHCEGLVVPPELPATTLAAECYHEMFSGCYSLVVAPKLPVTTMERACYYGMFYECSSLLAAPELPATTMVQDCYHVMFSDCDSLTSIELPAITAANQCYRNMFDGCDNLSLIVSKTRNLRDTDNTSDNAYEWIRNTNGGKLINLSKTSWSIAQGNWTYISFDGRA